MGIGYAIGVGAVAPGISGGAIAVVFGVYQRMTEAITHFLEDIRTHAAFLLPIGIGGLLGVVSLGRGLEFCFTRYPDATKAVFLGLMAGTLPSVIRTACHDGTRKWYPLITAATCVGGLCILYGIGGGVAAATLSFTQMLLCGAILGFGTVVPGVSSSFILLSIGWYEPLLRVLGGRDLRGIAPLAIGFCGTAAVLIGAVDLLYKKWYGATSFAVLGLLISSMAPIVPPLKMNRASCYILLTVIVCAVLSYGTMRYAQRGVRMRRKAEAKK